MSMDLAFKPFSGVGIVSFYRRNPTTGVPSEGGYDLGETVKLDITQTAPKLEMNTSRSSDRGVAFSMAQNKTGQVAITLKTVNDFIWALLTSGTWTETAAGSAVTGWVAPTSLVVNQIIKVPAQNLSAVVVKDSAGSPATLSAVNDYELDAVAGTIRIKNLGTYVQPFKVDYTPGAIKTLGGLKAADEDWICYFNGTNSYDGSRAMLEIFKYRFAPEGTLSMISDGSQFPEYQLNGSLQKDEIKAANSAGGQYYKLILPNTHRGATMSDAIEFVQPLALPFEDGDLALTVRPVTMGVLLAALGKIKPIADDVLAMPQPMIERLSAGVPEAIDIAWLYELLCERGELALDLVALATGLERERVAALLPDRFVYLFGLVVEVNADFFGRAPGVLKAAWARAEKALTAAQAQRAPSPSPKPSTS